MLLLENGGTRQSRHFGLSIRASDPIVQVDRYGRTLDSDLEFVGILTTITPIIYGWRGIAGTLKVTGREMERRTRNIAR